MGCITSSSAVRTAGDRSDKVNLDHFVIQRVIGKGGYGKVNAVTKRDDEDAWLALKTLNKKEIIRRESFREVFVERDLLAQLSHPRICNSYFAFQDEHHLYLVMDLALGGDLRYQLNNAYQGRPFPENQCRMYFAQIVQALEYIHGQNVLHRDIKPENILLDSYGWLKLTDFGIARFMDENGYCYSVSGTPGYMAPELYKEDHRHGRESDYFSLGVTLYEMLTKSRPYEVPEWSRFPVSTERVKDLSNVEEHRVMLNLKQVQSLSRECCEILRSALKVSPVERLGNYAVPKVRNFAWFSSEDFCWECVEMGTVRAPYLPDTSKMNADPNVDIRDIFFREADEESLVSLSPDEQLKFQGYEYDYRFDGKRPLRSYDSASSARLLSPRASSNDSEDAGNETKENSIDSSEEKLDFVSNKFSGINDKGSENNDQPQTYGDREVTVIS